MMFYPVIPQDLRVEASPTFENLTITVDAAIGNNLTVTGYARATSALYAGIADGTSLTGWNYKTGAVPIAVESSNNARLVIESSAALATLSLISGTSDANKRHAGFYVYNDEKMHAANLVGSTPSITDVFTWDIGTGVGDVTFNYDLFIVGVLSVENGGMLIDKDSIITTWVDMTIRSESGTFEFVSQEDEDVILVWTGNPDGRIKWYQDEPYFAAEVYNSGVWQPAEFQVAYGSLLFGDNARLSAAGDLLFTSSIDRSNRHTYPRVKFNNEVGTEELKTPHITELLEHSIIWSDDTSEWSGTSFNYTVSIDYDILSINIFLKVGSINATQGVTLQIYEGVDATATLKFKQIYPAAQFSSRSGTIAATDSGGVARFTLDTATQWGLWVDQEIVNSGFTANTVYNGTFLITSTDGSTWYEVSTVSYGSDESGSWATSEIKLDTSDFVDVDISPDAFFVYSSTATFSLKSNAAQTQFWLATSYHNSHWDEALITKEWTENDSTTAGDWYISHVNRKIYVANSPQTKGSTFSGDSQYWNELSPFVFSWEHLPSTQDLLIPTYHQMAVHGTFTLESQLNLDGTLAIRN